MDVSLHRAFPVILPRPPFVVDLRLVLRQGALSSFRRYLSKPGPPERKDPAWAVYPNLKRLVVNLRATNSSTDFYSVLMQLGRGQLDM